MFNNKINDYFYSTLSLPKTELVILDINETLDSRVIIDIKWKKNNQRCPICGKNSSKTTWDKLEIVRWIKHMHLSNYKTIELNIHKKRYVCEKCTKKN